MNHNNQRRKLSLFIIIFLLVIAVGFVVVRRLGGHKQATTKPNNQTSVSMNQTFTFVGHDRDGNSTDSQLTLAFTKASKQNSVTIQGKRATTKDGKLFLVLNFKVKNDTQKALYLLPVDLIRLIVDKDTKVAPSVHQGLLEVRPIASKLSNLGFVVDGSRNEFKFEVGEVDGKKQEMTIKL